MHDDKQGAHNEHRPRQLGSRLCGPVSVCRGGLIMTNRRRSATTRSVRAQTPEQLLELTQEYIRPLIGMIDELNEAGAEDELRVIRQQLTRLVFRAQPLPRAASSPKNRSARHRAALSPS